MPHIIIEHDIKTKNDIDLKTLTQKLHSTLAKQETVKLEAIKTRTIEVDNVIIGKGEINQFIHINVFLLSGRSNELKHTMARALFDITKQLIEKNKISLSINVSELGSYIKD